MKPSTQKLQNTSVYTSEEINQEKTLYNKSICSLSKNYFRDIFSELYTLLSEFKGVDNLDISLQLFCEKFEVKDIMHSKYYNAFVEHDRIKVVDKRLFDLTPQMIEIIANYNWNVDYKYYENEGMILIPLTTKNLANNEFDCYGFLNLTFKPSIKPDIIERFIAPMAIAESEQMCYYIKVIQAALLVFDASLSKTNKKQLTDNNDLMGTLFNNY